MTTLRVSSGDSSRKDPEERRELVTLGNRFLQESLLNGNKEESENPKDTITRAEDIARNTQKPSNGGKAGGKTNAKLHDYAQSLHRQADLLRNKGDYEEALVLYHRAASACPRDTRHAVAARKTAALISSVTNHPKLADKILPEVTSVAQLASITCPETAAKQAQKIVEESTDPVSTIDQILKYFDLRKDFTRDSTITRDRRRSALISRSRVTLRQLGSMASVALENLQEAFASNDYAASLRIGNELLTIAEPLIERYRYVVAARHYLAMSHVSLGRHDRAIDEVTRMIGTAKKSGNASLISRSIMTLGRVHLTFRHLDAAARAWEKLLMDMNEAVPKAWLLHEIGRCYFEMRRYGEALNTSRRCLEYAALGKSKKWLLYGQLLNGQALVELGRLGEAVIALERVKGMADKDKDKETRDYVCELIDRIVVTLRQDLATFRASDETARGDDSSAVKEACQAGSEDVPKSMESSVLRSFRQKSENLAIAPSLRSKLYKSRGATIKFTRKLSGRKRNRISAVKTRPKLFTKIAKCSVTMSTSDGSYSSDDSVTRDHNVIASKDCDQAPGDLWILGTGAIEKKCSRSKIIIEELLTMKKKSLIDDGPSSDDGKDSNRSGRTYVLDKTL